MRCPAFLTALLVTLPLTAAAQVFVPIIPADRVESYPLIIASSGDEADVYYPNPALARFREGSNRYPIVVMMQGASVDKEYYSMLATGVARQGFIVVVPNQGNRVFGNAFRYAEVHTITEVLEQMRAEDNSPDSPVYQIADPDRLAIMGHSFGGAATMFATADFCEFPFCDKTTGFQRPPELRAVVLTSSHSGAFDFDTSGIPVAIVGGSLDAGRPKQQATYKVLETPKAFITVEGATHYGMCDADVPPEAGEIEGEPEQLLPNGISATRYAKWAGTFLRAHVHDDRRATRRIYLPAENISGITIESQRQ